MNAYELSLWLSAISDEDLKTTEVWLEVMGEGVKGPYELITAHYYSPVYPDTKGSVILINK